MATMRFVKAVRTDLDHAIGLGDMSTADVLREISRKVGEVMILLLGALTAPHRDRRNDVPVSRHMLQVSKRIPAPFSKA